MNRIDWRSRTAWFRIGYALTAVWMTFVILVTGNDLAHPLFRYLFVVPLAGWIAGLLVGRVVGRLWPSRSDGG
ncbi:MAG: hypothetical protein ACE5LF_01495 [Alphaproteobacteria bacterium]